MMSQEGDAGAYVFHALSRYERLDLIISAVSALLTVGSVVAIFFQIRQAAGIEADNHKRQQCQATLDLPKR